MPSFAATSRKTPLAVALIAALGLASPTLIAATRAVNACGDGGTDTLREAVAIADDGDTIDLTHLPLGCSTITLESGAIVVTTPHLSIQGPGPSDLTIDAAGASGVFSTKYSLEIRDVAITGGFADDGGGCVYAGADLVLSRTTITGCRAGDGSGESARGGAIEVRGHLEMTDSLVSGSVAEAAGAALGGAVYVGGSATIAGGTIAANRALAGTRDARGGALHVNGIADMSASTLIDNIARSAEGSAYGGAIAARGAVTITGYSVIGGNLARSDGERWSYGGGVVAGEYFSSGDSDVVIADSTIAGNTSSSACDSCTVIGGGVLAFGTIDATRSTIHDNRAIVDADASGYAAGGGLATRRYGIDGKIALTNATVSGNVAFGGQQGYGFGYGGGVAAIDQSPFAFANSTIAFNEAEAFGGGAVGSGYAALLSIESTIVANNVANAGADLATTDGAPTTIGGSHNLVIDARSEITFVQSPIVDDPLLEPLAKNGGFAPNHALAPCSKAIDAGANPAALHTDQRGGSYARESGSQPDIGAFERQAFESGGDPPLCH